MVKLPQHLTCLNIHEHSVEGWDVAAPDSLQHLYHVADLLGSQLVVNAFQVLTPATTKTAVPSHHSFPLALIQDFLQLHMG